MTLRIEFLEEADREIDEAFAWYAQRSSKAPMAFLQRLTAAFERIVQHPDLYPTTFDGYRFCKVTKYPYLVIFEKHDERIVVVAIAHGKRQPGYWRDRT